MDVSVRTGPNEKEISRGMVSWQTRLSYFCQGPFDSIGWLGLRMYIMLCGQNVSTLGGAVSKRADTNSASDCYRVNRAKVNLSNAREQNQ
jgi:hypothetical protein